jgi:hypothetical protein
MVGMEIAIQTVGRVSIRPESGIPPVIDNT